MNPIRKPLNSEGNLPFSLVYHQPKGREEEWPDHLHEWCELVYIHDGEATFFIDQHVMQLKKGDLVFIPPNIIHRTMIEFKHTLTISALYLLPMYSSQETNNHAILFDLFMQAKRKKIFRHALPSEKQTFIEHHLETMNIERRSEGYFWEEAAFTNIIQLMIQLHRWIDTFNTEIEKPPTNLLWIKTIIEYMDAHLHETIRLDDLASQACISSVHFSKKFKQTVGITVSDFLAKKRILRAKELLKETDKSIQEVAELSGYHSMPYFHRTFKQEVGETPAKYRKK